jgi:hypothetical protein
MLAMVTTTNFPSRDIQASKQLQIDYGMGEGDDGLGLGWFALGLL